MKLPQPIANDLGRVECWPCELAGADADHDAMLLVKPVILFSKKWITELPLDPHQELAFYLNRTVSILKPRKMNNADRHSATRLYMSYFGRSIRPLYYCAGERANTGTLGEMKMFLDDYAHVKRGMDERKLKRRLRLLLYHSYISFGSVIVCNPQYSKRRGVHANRTPEKDQLLDLLVNILLIEDAIHAINGIVWPISTHDEV